MQNIKYIGMNGQISLGKENAGKMVSIEHTTENVWIIRAGKFMPDSQQWLYHDDGLQRLNKALTHALKRPPEDNFEMLAKDLCNDDKNRHE